MTLSIPPFSAVILHTRHFVNALREPEILFQFIQKSCEFFKAAGIHIQVEQVGIVRFGCL